MIEWLINESFMDDKDEYLSELIYIEQEIFRKKINGLLVKLQPFVKKMKLKCFIFIATIFSYSFSCFLFEDM